MSASQAVGVTPTLVGRGTYRTFKVKSDKIAPFEFEAEAKPQIDIVVRTHDLRGRRSTGHTHPGPVFITVLEGESRSTNSTIRRARHTSYDKARDAWIQDVDTSGAMRAEYRQRMSP